MTIYTVSILTVIVIIIDWISGADWTDPKVENSYTSHAHLGSCFPNLLPGDGDRSCLWNFVFNFSKFLSGVRWTRCMICMAIGVVLMFV